MLEAVERGLRARLPPSSLSAGRSPLPPASLQGITGPSGPIGPPGPPGLPVCIWEGPGRLGWVEVAGESQLGHETQQDGLKLVWFGFWVTEARKLVGGIWVGDAEGPETRVWAREQQCILSAVPD